MKFRRRKIPILNILYPSVTCQAFSSLKMLPGVKRLFQPVGLLLVGLTVAVLFIFSLWEDFAKPSRIPLPNPVSTNALYPSRIPLLNLTNFRYLINNDICSKNKLFVVVLIHSHPANKETRNILRKTVPKEDLSDLGMRRVFLLARAENDIQDLYRKTSQSVIEEENLAHRDIVQGNFEEHYHNLTYKHIMGLDWALRYCSQVRFIIKMDDDIVVDLYQLRNRLKTRYELRDNLILGLLQVDAHPVRNKESKWHVSKDSYSDDTYAPFVSGWAYAMTLDAAQKIVKRAVDLPYFWIDDVHVTGTLAEQAGVKREGLNRFYTIHVDHLSCCVELPNYADYFCDFFAGPSEGDTEVMEKVLTHARFCYINTCLRRPPERDVSKTCVRAKSHPLGPLGKGKGEIVKVY